jgi:fructokinase
MHTAGGEGWTTADLLFMASQAALVCVTRGADGCLAATSTGEKVDVPGIPIPVADTVGAGDAFTAALLCRFLQGEPLERAAVFANAYAAIVASRPGGTPRVELAEVERLL